MTPEQERALALAQAREAEAAAVKKPEKPDVPGWESFGRGALDTFSFGFADEALAGGQTGFGLWGDFPKAMEHEQSVLNRAQQADPLTFAGGQAAGVVPSLFVPGMNLARGATLASTAGRAALAGGAFGALYGAGSSEGGLADRAAGASLGAVTGAGAGAALSPLGTAVGRWIGNRAASRAAPTTADIAKTASQAYGEAKNAGLVVTPDAFRRMTEDAVVAANAAGLRGAIQPKAYAALLDLAKTSTKGEPVTLEDIDLARQVVTNVLTSPDRNERRIAGIVLGKIDDFVENLQPTSTDVIAGDVKTGTAALVAARAAYKQKSKAEVIDRIFFKAENAPNSVVTLKGKFRQLSENENLFRKFDPEEQQAILQVVRGGPIRKGLEFLGKFSPTNPFGALVGTAAGATFGGGAVPAVAAAWGAKAAANAATKRQAEVAAALVKSQRAPFRAKSQSAEEVARALAAIPARATLPEMLDIERSAIGIR